MTKEEFENIIRPLVLLPRDQSKLLKQTLLKNFEKWQKEAINYSSCCKSDNEMLPSFLSKRNNRVYINVVEDADVTEQWNEYLKTS